MMISHWAKVRSYSSTSRSGKHVLKIELEYQDPSHMGFDMKELDEMIANAKTPPKRQRRLALPAPEEKQ